MDQLSGDRPYTIIHSIPEKMSDQFQVDMLEGTYYAWMTLTCFRFQWRSLKTLHYGLAMLLWMITLILVHGDFLAAPALLFHQRASSWHRSFLDVQCHDLTVKMILWMNRLVHTVPWSHWHLEFDLDKQNVRFLAALQYCNKLYK